MIKSATTRAFTLIELIVVIVIVAILASLLLPAFNMVEENGRTTKCAGNLRQIGVAMVLFAQDHNGYFPESGAVIPWSTKDAPPPNGSGQASWMEQLSVYINLSVNNNGATSNDPQNANGNSVFTCPSSRTAVAADKYYSYFNGVHAAYAVNQTFGPVKLQLIQHPNQQILSGDVTDWPTSGVVDADKDDYTQNPFDAEANFHRGRVNILFVDGHVAQLAWNPSLSPPGYFDVTAMSTHYTGTSLEDPNVTSYLDP